MRKQYSPEFKTKVTFEAIKGLKTMAQIASEYEIHSARVCEWKSEFLEKAKMIFDPQTNKNNEFADKEAMLFQQIGELTCEVAYLKKKLLGVSL